MYIERATFIYYLSNLMVIISCSLFRFDSTFSYFFQYIFCLFFTTIMFYQTLEIKDYYKPYFLVEAIFYLLREDKLFIILFGIYFYIKENDKVVRDLNILCGVFFVSGILESNLKMYSLCIFLVAIIN